MCPTRSTALHGVFCRNDVLEQKGELVPADPGDRVGLTHGSLQGA